jgi:hypothetical protein
LRIGTGFYELNLDLHNPEKASETLVGTTREFYLRQAYRPDEFRVRLEWWQTGAAGNPKRWCLVDDRNVFQAIKTSIFAGVVVTDTDTLMSLET